jgi:hypothetical protein
MIWLPYPSIPRSIATLAPDQLDDVVIEGLEALRCVFDPQRAFDGSYEMFRRSAAWLLVYVRQAELELGLHGYDPNPGPTQATLHFMRRNVPLAPVPPRWLGDKGFHLAQMSQLIKVDPGYYARRLPPNTPLDLPPIWPEG